MDLDIEKQFADLLRAAASQTVSEQDFWDKFKRLKLPAKDPFSKAAHNTAIHFWGNFHERNLLLMRRKPSRHQLQQGKDELNLIAEGLERDWPASELKRRMDDV
jgi:hypothetical protein